MNTDPDYPYNTDVTQLPLYQTAPKQIHICVSDEGVLGHLEPWNESIEANAHWCEDAATSTTVEYIRADIAGSWKPIAEMPEELKREDSRFLICNGAIVSSHYTYPSAISQPVIAQIYQGEMHLDNSVSNKVVGATHWMPLPTARQREAEEGWIQGAGSNRMSIEELQEMRNKERAAEIERLGYDPQRQLPGGG